MRFLVVCKLFALNKIAFEADTGSTEFSSEMFYAPTAILFAKVKTAI